MSTFDKIIAAILYAAAWGLLLFEAYLAGIAAFTPRTGGSPYPFVLVDTLIYTLVPSAIAFIFANTLLPNRLILRGYLAVLLVVSFVMLAAQLRPPIG